MATNKVPIHIVGVWRRVSPLMPAKLPNFWAATQKRTNRTCFWNKSTVCVLPLKVRANQGNTVNRMGKLAQV